MLGRMIVLKLSILVLVTVSSIPAMAQVSMLADAQAAMESGDYAAARAEYRQLVSDYPGHPIAWLGLARVHALTTEWAAAADAFKALEELGPLDPEVRQEYGDALRESGDLAGALEQYNLVIAQTSEPAEPDEHSSAVTPPKYEQPPLPEDPVFPLGLRRASAPPEDEAPDGGGILQLPSSATITEPPAPANTASREVPAAVRHGAGDTSAFNQLAPGDPTVFYQSRAREVAPEDPPEEEGSEDAADTDWLEKARDHADNDEWEEAVDAYQQFIDREEAGTDIHLEYANALREIGQIGMAKMEYNRVLHGDAHNIDAKLGLAKVLAQDGDLEEAMYLLDQIATDPEAFARARLTRAYCYLLNDYTTECWRDIGDLLALNPDNAAAVQMIIERQPTRESWLEIKALLLGVPGNEEAVELIEEIMDTEQRMSLILPDDPVGRAEALYNRGRYDEARREYEKLVRRDPMATHAWLRLGSMYRWEEDWDEAVAAYEAYLTLTPDDYEARLRYGQVLLWSGDAEGARDELRSLINDTGIPIDTYEQALVAYAAALSACGQSRESIKWFEEALIFLPHNIEARVAFAGNLAGMGMFDDAIVQYHLALKDDPTSEEAKLGLAQAYAWKGDNKAARAIYDELNLGGKHYAAAQVGKAYTYLWEGDRTRALALADDIALLEPNNPALAQLYQDLKYTGDPRVAVTVNQSHDRDDNDYSGINTVISIPLDARGTQLTLHNEDFKLDNTGRNEESAGVHTRVALSTPVGRRGRLYANAGFLDIENGNADDFDDWTWGASYRVQLTDNWNAGIGFFDHIMYDTTELTRNGIHLREWSVNSDWGVFDKDTRLFTQASLGKLSDGNKRVTYTLNLQRTRRWTDRGRMNYGFAMRGLDYKWDLANGYWDPDEYRYGELYADWFDESDNRIKFDGGVGYGFDDAKGTKGDSVWRYNVSLRTYVWKDRLLLKTGLLGSEAATNATVGDGYEMRSWFLTGEFKF